MKVTARVEAIGCCRACGSTRLRTFLDLGLMPLSDGLKDPEEIDGEDERFPLEVAMCQDCSLVQIRHTVAPEVLFADDYPYYSSFSDALIAHSKKNVDARIDELELGPENLAVELASNDGYLLQHYAARGVMVQGIDPAKGPVEAARKKGIPTHHEFFTEELAERLAAEGLQASVIHGNNVLAHVADTNGFVRGIKKILAPNGVAVIEVPYLRDLIEHAEFDTIYHEHLCYFSAHALKALFESNGLFLNRVERLTIHGGSLRLFVAQNASQQESVTKLLEEEQALGMTEMGYYESFSSDVEAVGKGLRQLITDLKANGKTIAGYGAAAKGAIMLEYAGLGREDLMWVADRNVHKQGRHMPGNHLPIVSPDQIMVDRPDYLLILPWNFKDEIMSQQAAYAAQGGQFIVPVPRPEILTGAPHAAKEAS
ncbi:MAG: class I SAM-dependent methyltransferase [Planctomycetota bacterium]